MTTEQLNSGRNAAMDEALRLDALHRLLILDTLPEPDFEEITRLTASMFPQSEALISFIDETRMWIKASTATERDTIPRHMSMCSLVIQQPGCTVVLDTRMDRRVIGSEYIYATEGPRFYAGAPLTTRDGQRVGVLCILGSMQRESFDEEEQEKLLILASLASDRMELRALQQHAMVNSRANAPGGIRSLGEQLLHLVPDIQPAMRARAQLKNELELGIQHGQLELYYQPEVDLNTNVIAGFEALVRWNHPDKGLLLPINFIQFAEETGLIIPLGDWVLGEACRQAAAWRAASQEKLDLRVSVNLSPVQFENPRFVETVTCIIEQTGLHPEELRLEVTEGTLMNCSSALLNTMKRLRTMGVGLHMDDFGTGYSSLHTLHALPFDTIKIDGSFITRIGKEDSAPQFIDTIIKLADSLKMEIVAECIETAHQAEMLRKMGCQYGQGHYFGRPLRSFQVSELIDKEICGSLPFEVPHFRANPHQAEIFGTAWH